MFGYIYLITNTKNNKKYIGQHKSDKLDYQYLGSNRELKIDIKTQGKQDFQIEILGIYESREELNLAEQEFIIKYDAVNSLDFYNYRNGGNVSERSESTREKMSHQFKLRDQSYFETLKSQCKGRIMINNGQITKMIWPDEFRMFESQGYKKGPLPYSKERVEAARQGLLNYPRSDEFKAKCKSAHSGKIYINKDSICKMINPNELDHYISLGWRKGRLKRK